MLGAAGPGLIRSWALELGSRHWSDCLEIITVGLGESLDGLERVRRVANIAEVAANLAAQAKEVAALVERPERTP